MNDAKQEGPSGPVEAVVGNVIHLGVLKYDRTSIPDRVISLSAVHTATLGKLMSQLALEMENLRDAALIGTELEPVIASTRNCSAKMEKLGISLGA